MPSNASRLNKEKLCLFAALVPASLAGYLFLATAPAPLKVSAPLTTQRGPSIQAPQSLTTASELAYFGGTRKTPFMPIRISKPPPEEGDKKIVIPVWWIDKQVDPRKLAKHDPPVNPASIYDFMGVVIYEGKTHGLLRSKSGAKPRRVQAGEELAEARYTVTRIEPQSIKLRDRDGNVFELKDWHTKQARANDAMTAAAEKL
jgi:hypothetical protein